MDKLEFLTGINVKNIFFHVNIMEIMFFLRIRVRG